MSLVARIIAKLLNDFTLVIHMRHPYEIGGVQFSLLIVLNQMGCFVAAVLYLKYYDGSYDADGNEVGGNNKVEDEMLWTLLACLCGLFLSSSSIFFALIDKKYLGTFFTTMIARQYTIELYASYTTDLQRVEAFDQHPTYYEGAEVELRAFIDENWEDWMADRPEWLTDYIIASIPDDYLKRAEVKRLEKEGGGKRIRRSSAFFLGERRTSAKVQPDVKADNPNQPPVDVKWGADPGSPQVRNENNLPLFLWISKREGTAVAS